MKRSITVLVLACGIGACAHHPVSGVTAASAQPIRQPGTGSIMAATSERAVGGSSAIEQPAGPQERMDRTQLAPDLRVFDPQFRRDEAAALDGDGDAALRIADMYARGASGVPQDEQRMVSWLLRASSLNNAAASYRLYQYYVQRGLDRDAVFFENRAIAQGFSLPLRLDARRGAGGF